MTVTPTPTFLKFQAMIHEADPKADKGPKTNNCVAVVESADQACGLCGEPTTQAWTTAPRCAKCQRAEIRSVDVKQ